jgi:hypothetical protein
MPHKTLEVPSHLEQCVIPVSQSRWCTTTQERVKIALPINLISNSTPPTKAAKIFSLQTWHALPAPIKTQLLHLLPKYPGLQGKELDQGTNFIPITLTSDFID